MCINRTVCTSDLADLWPTEWPATGQGQSWLRLMKELDFDIGVRTYPVHQFDYESYLLVVPAR